MTDMRATERLLEVIEENLTAIANAPIPLGEPYASKLSAIAVATYELRRRGDTLVRRDDLRLVLKLGAAMDDLRLAVLRALHIDRFVHWLAGKLR